MRAFFHSILSVFLFSSSICLANPGLSVNSRSFIVMRADGAIVAEKNSEQILPIASISKLIVAVSLDRGVIEPQDKIVVRRDNIVAYNRLLKPGDRYDYSVLLDLALVTSNNSASYAILPGDLSSNMSEINRWLKANGYTSMHLEEPSGLNAGNVSSAHDLAKFLLAVRHMDTARRSVAPVVLINKQKLKSTNPYVGHNDWQFSVSKTGWTVLAGGCVAVVLEVEGEQYAVVILGAKSVPARWQELQKIKTWIAHNAEKSVKIQPQTATFGDHDDGQKFQN